MRSKSIIISIVAIVIIAVGAVLPSIVLNIYEYRMLQTNFEYSNEDSRFAYEQPNYAEILLSEETSKNATYKSVEQIYLITLTSLMDAGVLPSTEIDDIQIIQTGNSGEWDKLNVFFNGSGFYAKLIITENLKYPLALGMGIETEDDINVEKHLIQFTKYYEMVGSIEQQDDLSYTFLTKDGCVKIRACSYEQDDIKVIEFTTMTQLYHN